MKEFTPNRRQCEILDLVQEHGFHSTEMFVERLNVTAQTIRRDLRELSKNNMLLRFHGGAGLLKDELNIPYEARRKVRSCEKDKIAKATVAKIPNDSSLFLNIGTTTEAVANELLGHSNLKVVTNNVNVAKILGKNDSFRIMVTGGLYRNNDGGIIGMDSANFINKFSLEIAVIGISGIDRNGDLLDFDYHEVQSSKSIIKNSQTILLVADQSKFGRRAMHKIGNLTDIDSIITDAELNLHYKKLTRAANVDVIVA